MRAKSIQGSTAEEIRTALSQSMEDGFQPTLAIVFASIKVNRGSLCAVLNDVGLAIYGSTTNGEFTESGITRGAIAILLLDIHQDYFKLFFSEYASTNYREVTRDIANQTLEKFNKPAFLITGSNMQTDSEELLHGFEEIIGHQVNVFGGMAGDDYAFAEQFVFSNFAESNNGIVVLALDESKITIKGRATCGWKAVGTEKTVTKSEGNHVYTVDNIPVLDITAKFGGIEDPTQDNKNLMFEIATSFPLQLQREKGDPVMRPGLVIDWTDHSFYCSGTVPQGSKIKFSLPPDFDVIEKVIKGCEKLKAEEMPEADALILFSCAGRQVALGPMIGEEIDGIRKVWDVPMAGMFSNAELARATDGNLEMHNLTACCVVLKEK